ncbi:MAG: hypothetical protein RBR97_20555 [Bacteroidales bacterium]|nr:hypothetical protein [Bacteroidales bacterium]
MIKSLIFFTITLFSANLMFCQNYRTIQFIDTLYNKPLHGVMVFIDGNFESVTDENGSCKIANDVNEIYCQCLGYKDTLLNVENCFQCIIKLKTYYNVLQEVQIDAKYDAKKHLLKLLQESQQTAYKIDTAIYYRFKEINTIPELGQTEIFSGILMVDNKGYSINTSFAYVSKILNYYNNIEQDNYELMHKSKILEKLNSDVLYTRSIKKIKRKRNVERPFFSTLDSISFAILTKQDENMLEYSYISFVNRNIRMREFAGTAHRNETYRKYYYKTYYSLFPISIPEHIVSSVEYVLKNNLVVNNYVELEKIDNPNIENELRVFLFNNSCKELVERAKTNSPDTIIPTQLIEK